MIKKISKEEAWAILSTEYLISLANSVTDIVNSLELGRTNKKKPFYHDEQSPFKIIEIPPEKFVRQIKHNDNVIFFDHIDEIYYDDFDRAYLFEDVIIISGENEKRAFKRCTSKNAP